MVFNGGCKTLWAAQRRTGAKLHHKISSLVGKLEKSNFTR